MRKHLFCFPFNVFRKSDFGNELIVDAKEAQRRNKTTFFAQLWLTCQQLLSYAYSMHYATLNCVNYVNSGKEPSQKHFQIHLCTCERDPDSLVEALQPLVTLTSTVRQEEIRAWAGQHVSVTCTNVVLFRGIVQVTILQQGQTASHEAIMSSLTTIPLVCYYSKYYGVLCLFKDSEQQLCNRVFLNFIWT